MNLEEKNARKEAKQLLDDFDNAFHSDDVKKLREFYPHYVALYTKFIFKPTIAIRGINPSWFIGKQPETDAEKKDEKRRVNSLKKLHDLNAYIDYPEPRYHQNIKKTFIKILNSFADNPLDDEAIFNWMRDDVVGWNNCFIQTGSVGLNKLIQDANYIDSLNFNSSCIDLIKESKRIAKKLESLMQPGLIIYAGQDAANENRWPKHKYDTLKSIQDNPKKTLWGGNAIAVKHFSWPDKGTNREFQIVESWVTPSNEEI